MRRITRFWLNGRYATGYIKLLKEYNGLLTKCLAKQAPYLATHNIKDTDEDITTGKRLRTAIAEMEQHYNLE